MGTQPASPCDGLPDMDTQCLERRYGPVLGIPVGSVL
eukprot:Gb_28250 [translate_table: standard]